MALVLLLALIPLCLGTVLILLYTRPQAFPTTKYIHPIPPPAPPIPRQKPHHKNNHPVQHEAGHGSFEKVAISSEHPTCSRAGLRMIDKGGNAVDAAIAVLLCVGVVNNFSSGIGGGGFMLIQKTESEKKERDEAVVVDFRETAPRAATEDMFVGREGDASEGGKSVAIPGELRGMEMAKKKFPSPLAWSELFGPAIELAEGGFPVTKRLHYLTKKGARVINRHETIRKLYMDSHGFPLPIGTIIKRENLARTLRIIAEKGADAFYEGEIAEDTVKMIKDNRGILDMDDLKDYKALLREPVRSTYREFEVTTAGPPASGAVVAYILNILETFTNLKSPFDGNNLHRIVEAGKFGFAGRMSLGDPKYVNVRERLQWMLEKETAQRKASNITDHAHPVEYYLESPEGEAAKGHGTTQVSIIDQREGGLSVSATSTVNQAFGSMLMSALTGILLNDHMDDFSTPNATNHFGLPPTPPNLIAPGKRPLSSAAPVILSSSNKVFLVTGAAGGSKIITSTVRSVLDVVDFALTPEASVNQPRMHHQLLPNALVMEEGNDARIVEEMRRRGHAVRLMDPGRFYAAVSMVQRRRDDGWLYAAADPRKGGDVAGL